MLQDNFFQDLVDAVFSAPSRAKANEILDKESEWYQKVLGSSANGMLGDKAVNGMTSYAQLIEENKQRDDDSDLDNTLLENLEAEETK